MRYRPPRNPAKRSVTLATGSPRAQHPAELRCISQTGARVTCAAALAPGTRLHLVVQGKRWTAKIVWSDQGEAGLAFSRPLTEGELNAIQNQGGVSTGLGAAPTRNHHGFREMR